MGVTHETKKTMNASTGNLATAAAPEPTVCCVMLVNGRPEMVRRAVASFRSQTYERKRLLLYDTSSALPAMLIDERGVLHFYRGATGATIGALRNEANEFAMLGVAPAEIDIIAHWDSDDWSHPHRLAEQVALLQASGADCAGYNQAVFWDERIIPPMKLGDGTQMGYPINAYEAWIYTSMVPKGILGASMLYWRTAWERKPFLDRMTGEDDRWLSGMKVCGVSGIGCQSSVTSSTGMITVHWSDTNHDPRLIAGVHGANTTKVNPCEGPREWRRAPELDGYCREKMQL